MTENPATLVPSWKEEELSLLDSVPPPDPLERYRPPTRQRLSEIQPVDHVIRGLLFREGVTVLAGQGECGKTAFYLQMALEAGAGRSSVLGCLTNELARPVRTLFLTPELTRSRFEGTVKKFQGGPARGHDDTFPTIDGLTDAEYDTFRANAAFWNEAWPEWDRDDGRAACSQILDVADVLKPDIVIVDSLYRLLGDISSERVAKMYANLLDPLKRVSGASILVVHHTTKDSETYFKGQRQLTTSRTYSGSATVRNNADWMALMEKSTSNGVQGVVPVELGGGLTGIRQTSIIDFNHAVTGKARETGCKNLRVHLYGIESDEAKHWGTDEWMRVSAEVLDRGTAADAMNDGLDGTRKAAALLDEMVAGVQYLRRTDFYDRGKKLPKPKLLAAWSSLVRMGEWSERKTNRKLKDAVQAEHGIQMDKCTSTTLVVIRTCFLPEGV